jgi:hypothetical protein
MPGKTVTFDGRNAPRFEAFIRDIRSFGRRFDGVWRPCPAFAAIVLFPSRVEIGPCFRGRAKRGKGPNPSKIRDARELKHPVMNRPSVGEDIQRFGESFRVFRDYASHHQSVAFAVFEIGESTKKFRGRIHKST